MKKHLAILYLAFIVLSGFFLRFYRLIEIPPGLLPDEAAAGYDAYALLQTGKDHHGAKFPLTFLTFGDWTGHSFNYQLIPFIYIFGLNKFAIRTAVAFLSAVTILLIYLLGKTLTGKNKVSLVMALLFAQSTFSISTSRWAVQPNTVPFFVTFGLLVFFWAINTNKGYIFFSLSGILYGLSLYSYPSVEGFIPIWLIGASLIYYFMRPASKKRVILSRILFLLLSFFITSMPLLTDHLLRPETIFIRLKMVSIFTQSENFLLSFVKNYISYFLPVPLFISDRNLIRAVTEFFNENMF